MYNSQNDSEQHRQMKKTISYDHLKAQIELKARLYDKGFNMGTMPSVKRPETSKSKDKVLTAKLNSQQTRQNKNQQPVYQHQSIALHKREQKDSLLPQLQQKQNPDQEFLKLDKIDESDLHQFGRTMPVRAQTATMKTQSQKQLPSLLEYTKQTAEVQQKLQVSKRPETAVQRIKGNQTTQKLYTEKPTTANIDRQQKLQSEQLTRIQSANQHEFNVGFDFHMSIHKPELLFGPPPLSRINSAKFSTTKINSKNAFNDQNIKLQDIFGQPQEQEEIPQFKYQGFEDKEIPSTKFIVDKLSGKFNIDKRYLSRPTTAVSKQLNIKEEEILEENQPEIKVDSHNITSYKRPATKLDKYIDLILKNVTNVNEFIYLNANNDDDPYDLQVVDFKKIQENERNSQLKEYYTISRKGLCHYINGKPIEFIQLAYWLKERETYDQIKSLQFFTKFRKWKTLKMWRKNVIRHKNSNCARALEEKLFYLNPIMRKSLLEFRRLTYDMMIQLRFIGIDDKDNFLPGQEQIYTLQQFKEHQDKIRKKVNQDIQIFSTKCRDIVKLGFDDSLAKLRKDQYMSNNEDDFVAGGQKKQSQNMFGLKESAYDALGFPDNMTYEKRSELRKECSKFLRFAYLVDFIAMESLSKIFIYSVQELEDRLKLLVETESDIFIAKDPTQKNFSTNDLGPMFQVVIQPQLQIDLITPDQYDIQKINEFIPHPTGNSFPEDFNIKYHVRLKPPKQIKEEKPPVKGKPNQPPPPEDSESEDFVLNEDTQYNRIIVPNISDLWLKIYPDKDMFFKDLMKCIAEGANSIQAFERWSRHDDMKKYVKVLEEWDDIVGDDWENPDSNYLNPSEWLDNSPNEMFQGVFKKLVELAFNKIDLFTKQQFHNFLLLYWEDQKINFELFKSEQLSNAAEAYYYSFKILNIQKEYFEKEIPYSADIGLLRVDTSELRKQIVGQPDKMLKIFQDFVPVMIQERNDMIRQWLNNQASLLKSNAPNIDEFVKRQNNLKETLQLLPKFRRKFSNLDHIKHIMIEFKFELTKELLTQILETTQDLKRLENIIQSAEDQQDKNIEKYVKDVTSKLIPELEKQTHELEALMQDKKYLSLDLNLEQAIKELEDLDQQYKALEDRSKLYNHYEKTLSLPFTRYEDLEILKIDLQLRLSMWKSLKEWQQLTSNWIDGKFNEINVKEIKEKADFYTKIVSKCIKNLPQNNVLEKLKIMVHQFKEAMPVVVALRNKELKDYHWIEIKKIIGKEFTITEDFTLKNLLDMGVTENVYEIQEVAAQATQEAVLKTSYEEINGKWKQLQFTIKESKEGRSKDVILLTNVDDLYAALDELLANLNTILGSRYLKTMRDEVDALQKRVLNVQEVIDDMLIVQKNWIYLENIFKSPEIRSKLKEETSFFDKVDTFFKKQLINIKKNPFVNKCIGFKSKKDWNTQKEILDTIQQALDNLLEDKRRMFPRFYFLSNDELLEILAKSGDIDAIQKNMKKCFDGVHRLVLSEQGVIRNIIGMQSPEGEKIMFTGRVVSPKGDVEVWLATFQECMKEILFKNMKKGKLDYEGTNKERHEWVLDHSAQVIGTVAMIMWTQYTELFIQQMAEENPNALYDWTCLNHQQLEALTKLIVGGLPDIQHKSIVALITEDVHGRDILDNMYEEGVCTVQDFLWQKQLRYYWGDDDKESIFVKQVNATLKYGFEYIGATSRLVITPLTDRAWMTITGALNIQLGAAPAGPAGTGKTESTKDLAKGLGMICVVFNCSEQIEYKLMGRLFSGLSEQGAWACLDEFNRIDIEVLSVIAQQLQTIRIALVKRDEKFIFIDKEIVLKADGYGVFITMNPGYAGRTELPDNLKVQFRPVAMMIPDYCMIAEIMLFSEGFENASSLSVKMVQLYKLASEQLSQQDHYDFGMRAVKSVLNMAGNLKREQPDLTEVVVLIRAMRDSNIPKFLTDDLKLFTALIQDLFPEVDIPNSDYKELPGQIVESMQQLKFQFIPTMCTKVIQLFETLNVRFGVMLVGQTASGKTTCYQILANVMTQLKLNGSLDKRYQEVNYKVINPKSISMGELYGEVNISTYEWIDGLCSSLMREAVSDETDKKQWVIFDGPVDAIWIENMNTVLDDNMMLCLANGERIKLRTQMRMVFEVQDLSVASPATVSRCGMVYMVCDDLGWKPYVYSWINEKFSTKDGKQKTEGEELIEEDQSLEIKEKKKEEFLSEELRVYLASLFEISVDRTIQYIRSKLQEMIVTVDLQLVVSLCNLLDCFISEQFGFKKNDKIEEKKRYITHVFAFAFIWSVSITIIDSQHDFLNNLIRDIFQNVIFPNQETVYSYFLDVQNDLLFKHWNDKITEFQYDKEVPYFNILVPTIDTTRYSFIIQQLIQFKKHIYVTGYGGTGKSVLIQSLLAEMKEPNQVDSYQIIFSAQTSSLATQLTVEDKLKKKSKIEYGATSGRQNVIFVDDCNMPQIEKFGAQPPIELLRLFIDKGYFWDRRERFQKIITDTTLLCCSSPPGGGRQSVTQRFTRHFNLLALPSANYKTLHQIFKSLIFGFFQVCDFQQQIQASSDHIVNMTIETYQRFLQEKLPIPSKFHYTFNLRDVSKVFQGIMMSSPSLIRDEQQLSKLWAHEVSRVFSDRLINDIDRNWFYDLAIELLQRNFKGKFDKEKLFIESQILYSDILRLEMNKEYEEITDIQKLIKTLEEKLEEYNASDSNVSKMNLVFFDQCISHTLRIMRILRQVRGNAMLIGVGGSGKQSLSKLSSFTYQYQVEQIEIKKDYNSQSFREFIQNNLMYATGVQGKSVTFLFTDTQILQESFLEDINNILNSGEVPNMWKAEDKENILNEIKEINARNKKATDPETCQKTFVERVRNNLHIILCMSPIGNALRVRCRQFPSLVDCCALNWFSSWSEQALQTVSTKLLQDDVSFPQSNQIPKQDLINKLSFLSKEIHKLSQSQTEKFELALKRKVYFTPKSYLDFIKLFITLLKAKRTEALTTQKRLSDGLTKLEEANKQIADLQISLNNLKPELEIQNKAVAAALKQVEKDTYVAQQKEAIVSEETDKVQKQKDKVQLIAEDAQAVLDKVMPELNKAQEAVEKIDKTQLVNLRTMPSMFLFIQLLDPPSIVLMVFEGVCALLGQKSDWATCKSLLMDLNKFIQSLINFDKDNIPQTRLKKLNQVLARPEFDLPTIQQKVAYVADLAMFCRAMKIYADTFEKVKPKKKQVIELQAELDVTNAALQKQLDALNLVQASVQKLREETNHMMQKKEDLEHLMELTEHRLQRAKKLIILTENEAQRWKVTVDSLSSEIEQLMGDVFLSSASISYNGPFTGIFRKELTDLWNQLTNEYKIPKSEIFSIIKTLGDPVQMRGWGLQGLPSDVVSQENSLFAMKSEKWPLLIDPQIQATKWIRNMESKNLICLKLQDNWIRDLALAISNGKTVLIEEVNEVIDPGLDTVLLKSFYVVEGQTKIKFGDSDILYDKNFRLYLATERPNPDYLPEIFIKVNVINFTSTFEGLEDQMLADVVKNEQPKVERQRDMNVLNLAIFKQRIQESEINILRLLAEASADTILDNVNLIYSLEVSKNTAQEINNQLIESEILERTINEIRESYRAVSIRGSILYFVIKDLSLLDPMYQYSQQYIQKLFNLAMQNTVVQENQDPKDRLNCLIDSITKTIFTNVCRGLFEKDKLIFSFLISTSINRNSGILLDQAWSIFLRGPSVFDKSKQPQIPSKELFSQASWDLAYYLDITFEEFAGITKHIIMKINLWKEYATSSNPLTFPLPEQWNKLEIFQKMLILKIFRPEKILFAVSIYIEHYLGNFYLNSPQISMENLHLDSDPKTPIIFVLSQGADPSQNVIQFAQFMNMDDKLKLLSLGQGQGQKAEILIQQGQQEGTWVFLQNCHLAKTWMPNFEIIMSNIRDKDIKDINSNFRIFLTSMPASYFPVSILQNSIKVTTEPPRGLKANMKRSFGNLTDDFLNSCKKEGLNQVFHKLLWGLTYFHALIQERRKFGPLGWNVRYEFNDSDLETSIKVMKMLLEDQEQIPWDAMLFVSGHINYGGRVTDDWDRRCLISMLKKFYTEEALKENYLFSESNIYTIPQLSNLETYKQHIDQFPLHEDPRVFGLNENADITYQSQESNSIIKTILQIQPKTVATAGGKSNDNLVENLIEIIIKQIPDDLNKDVGFKELFETNELGFIPSLTTVLLQEMARFNILLQTIRISLKNLKLSIEGLMIMSEDLDSCYYSLLNNNIPSIWVNVAYPSLKSLGSWILDLVERVQFIYEWLTTGNPNGYWISGFFFPQGFLTGVLQTHARKYKTAIDQLNFSYRVLDFDKENCVIKPIDGVYIYGFYLEGASWDRKKKTLVDAPLGQTYYKMPVIHFNPTQNLQKKIDDYSCPVYKTSNRIGQLSTTGQNSIFIIAVDLPSLDHLADYWVLRGTALLAQLND